MDAVSVTFGDAQDTATISGKLPDGSWTPWQELHVENEQDPTLLESNLVLFPSAVTDVRLQGSSVTAIHPINVASDSVSYKLAALSAGSQPHILSRSEWGADDSLLFSGSSASGTDEAGDNGDTAGSSSSSAAVSARVQKCLDDQKNSPADFKVAKTVKTEDGKTLRWAHQYSKKIKLLVVHHTALQATGETRSGAERMRALYAYHANNRGWGDVGYNFVIDDQGEIFEGKSGGAYVVAGHAYCNNVGTIGISLMGNFDIEQPTQAQVQALQWLLATLADQYDVDPAAEVDFHGVREPTIVGHRDLLSTDCPGFYMYGVLDQVRRNVAEGELTARVTFPQKPKNPADVPRTDRTDTRKQERLKREQVPAFREGITPTGASSFSGRGMAQQLFTLRYQAGGAGTKKGQTIATVSRGSDDIGLWMEKDGEFVRVRNDIDAPTPVPAGGQLLLRMRLQMPQKEGTYQLQIGGSALVLNVTGRAQPSRQAPTQQTSSRSPERSVSSRSSTATQSSSVRRPAVSSSPAQTVDDTQYIRIRLKSREAGLLSCRDADLTGLLQYYRGSVNCLIVDGAPALINVLSLEDYMMGLGEEPDTEPYEKQRAFAIAARTYAAYYMDPAHRKFEGKPYDGSDSAAEFQKYVGKTFEADNTRWLVAVRDTRDTVLTKNGQVIKPAYFSSDDGRTRSADDAGWSTFPFKEIFTSKADPWCEGMQNRGHGVGMSGCGAEGQANEGKKAEEILLYYYPTTVLAPFTGTRP